VFYEILMNTLLVKGVPPVLADGYVAQQAIGWLYDHPDGACSEYLAEQLKLPGDEVRDAMSALVHAERAFIYYESRPGGGGSARWRLSADEWLKEAARREAQSRRDS